jgi:hypothetical protein
MSAANTAQVLAEGIGEHNAEPTTKKMIATMEASNFNRDDESIHVSVSRPAVEPSS